MPGAGVGHGNRVRFLEIPEDTCVAGRVGVEASGASPKGQGKTQRDMILIFDGFVHDLQNSLVAGVAGNVLGDEGILAASARRGENEVGGHS